MTPNTPKASPALSGEAIQLVGIKADGSEHDLGPIAEVHVPKFKMREIVASYFGHDFKEGSDADMALAALEEFQRWYKAGLDALSPAQAEPLGQAGAWMDIATAPKDGQEVILRRGNRVGAACWVKWPAREDEDGGEGWTIGADGDSWDADKSPTHYQSLPPAPTQEHK